MLVQVKQEAHLGIQQFHLHLDLLKHWLFQQEEQLQRGIWQLTHGLLQLHEVRSQQRGFSRSGKQQQRQIHETFKQGIPLHEVAQMLSMEVLLATKDYNLTGMT